MRIAGPAGHGNGDPSVNGALSARVRQRADALDACSCADRRVNAVPFLSPMDEARFSRGPLRPERLAPVRERLSGAVLRRVFQAVKI